MSRLVDLDRLFDQGNGTDVLVNEQTVLLKELQDIHDRSSIDMAQKAKIRWSIEGDENSKYFHGILNKKRSQLTIRGVLVEGDWVDEPALVKDPERSIVYDEIKREVWDCGTNKSPGPGGFTFDFIRRYWKTIDKDVVKAVKEFFVSSNFPPGSNASFITLFPKMQILDGPFILNELISWCKSKKTKAMIFKVDFKKAFDSVRWDFLDDILNKFGFGTKWRGWIQGCLNSAMGSILVNGSPTSEFKFHKGLKQGNPLSPFLFILIMESLHLSFNHILNVGLFKGIQIDNSLTLSHLFYADDAVFIGKWDKSNLITIVNMLKCFFLAPGLKINIHKSKLIGIGIPHEEVISAANFIGCSTLTMPFNYLGVKVGAHSSRSSSWEEVIAKLFSRLSKWKLKTLSIGGRLTLIKSVLSSMPLYHKSIYKVPLGVLNKMESLRRNFFNGVDNKERKLFMIGWKKVLASKNKRGLGAMYGVRGSLDNPGSLSRNSPWSDIIKEAVSLSIKGINFLSYVKKKVGNGEHTCFWEDVWLDDHPLKLSFPRLYALKCDKEVSVAAILIDSSLTGSFRRNSRGGIEEEQYLLLVEKVASVILSNGKDRWTWSLASSGEFSVKSARIHIDDILLPSVGSVTR
uniref:RNA-directed DNA polymerase, eukaryota n=1 Tax=Tanacetum cinerariifolium TaxID=118510 RepID=A0A699GXA0_TANCI|nr:RNA-directed DNA polymerase, eukaryota [Tanacetum cinerariifolium]